MQIKITRLNALAFLSLMFVVMEAHELTHITVARFICGCWGVRNSFIWEICAGCQQQHPLSLLATLAGPIFSYILIWSGRSMLKHGERYSYRSLGFSLIFANLPFARLFTAALGKGDEITFVSTLLDPKKTGILGAISHVFGFFIVFLATIPPLITAYKSIGNKARIWYFVGLLIIPMCIDGAVGHTMLNWLLDHGWADGYGILGSPVLLTIWLAATTILLVYTWKHLYNILISSK